MYDIKTIIVIIVILTFIAIAYNIYTCETSHEKDVRNKSDISEHFGALQSLYSNDGIQDAYLTVDTDRGYYDPYKYWRGVTWDLPTRNLDDRVFYPYMYEYNVDRYARLYPYW